MKYLLLIAAAIACFADTPFAATDRTVTIPDSIANGKADGLMGVLSHRENTTWKASGFGTQHAIEGAEPEWEETGEVTDDTILTVEWKGEKKEFTLESKSLRQLHRTWHWEHKKVYTDAK